MSRAMLIVNPDSGRREGRPLSSKVRVVLEGLFECVDLRLSSCGSDVAAWSREARETAVDALFLMGGDGTASLGLLGLFDGYEEGDAMPVVAILPAGTGNGMARTLGIPPNPLQALDAYDFDSVFSFDVGTVNGRPFAHTVTGGVLPEGIRRVSSDFKTRFGFLAYAVSELFRVGADERYEIHVNVDGEVHVEEANSFVVFSANAFVRDFVSKGATSYDDGELCFMALRRATLPSLLSLIPYVATRRVERSPQVVLLRGERMDIMCDDSDLTCGIDGDEGPLPPLRLAVLPRALRMFSLKRRAFRAKLL